MKLVEFAKALKLLGYPVAFSHFETDEDNPPPTLPFITYVTPNSDHFVADDRVYHKIHDVDIELYTATKDFIAEQAIEDFLDAHDLPYSDYQVWIESEKVFQKTYEVRLI